MRKSFDPLCTYDNALDPPALGSSYVPSHVLYHTIPTVDHMIPHMVPVLPLRKDT